MAGCSNCNFKGYIESVRMCGSGLEEDDEDANVATTLAQCPKCKDIVAYSKEVQRRMRPDNSVAIPVFQNSDTTNVVNLASANVLQFPRKPRGNIQ